MRISLITAFFLILFISGCSTPHSNKDYLRPAIINEPLFVVVPANNSVGQNKFATAVEHDLLKHGMRVAVRPALKAVVIETSGLDSQAASGFSARASSSIGSIFKRGEEQALDSFLALSQTNASYRINSYAYNSVIEIVDIENKQVLGIIFRANINSKSKESSLGRALRLIGFNVKGSSASAKKELVSDTSQPKPILTVVPSEPIGSDTLFALRIERLLIKLGLHVVRPPAPHFKAHSSKLDKAAAKRSSGDNDIQAESVKKMESYWEYENTVADVILQSSSRDNSIKIIDKKSNEIHALFTLEEAWKSEAQSMRRIRNYLMANGIPVNRDIPKLKVRAKNKTQF